MVELEKQQMLFKKERDKKCLKSETAVFFTASHSRLSIAPVCITAQAYRMIKV